MNDEEDQHFGEEEPFTLGLEEELFVVDPDDGHLLNVGPEVLEHLGELERGEVKNELHKSQIELITSSTACAATCRCSRRSRPTRPFATAATPAWPRRAR